MSGIIRQPGQRYSRHMGRHPPLPRGLYHDANAANRRRTGFAYIAAWLSIFLLPLASAPLPGIASVSPPNTLFYIFATLTLGSILVKRRVKTYWTEPGCCILGLLVLWMFISIIFNGGKPTLVANVITAIGAIVFYFVGLCLAYEDSAGWKWESAIFLGALIAAVSGLLHYIGALPLFGFEKMGVAARSIAGLEFSERGVKGLIIASGDYAIWLLAGVMVAHRWLCRTKVKWWLRMVSAAAAIAMILAVIVSQSRSGWLTLAIFLVIYWLGLWVLAENSALRRNYLIVILIAIAGAAASLLFLSGAGQNIIHAFVSIQTASVQNRLGGYSDALVEIFANPIFGAGKFFAVYEGHSFVVHNTMFAFMSNYGILAGLFFAALFVFVMYKALFYVRYLPYLTQRRECLALLAALMGSAVTISLFSGIGSKFFFALLGCVSGALFSYSRQNSVARKR